MLMVGLVVVIRLSLLSFRVSLVMVSILSVLLMWNWRDEGDVVCVV